MFDEFLKIWRKKSLTAETVDQALDMLAKTREMFVESMWSLRESDTGELRLDVYQHDKTINKLDDYKSKIRLLMGETVSDIAPALRGWEGLASKVYFDTLNLFIPESPGIGIFIVLRVGRGLSSEFIIYRSFISLTSCIIHM